MGRLAFEHVTQFSNANTGHALNSNKHSERYVNEAPRYFMLHGGIHDEGGSCAEIGMQWRSP